MPINNIFSCSWARGYGLAQLLVAEAEDFAKSEGYKIINLDVRSTQDRAI